MGETNPPADPYPLNAFDPGGWAPGLASALAFLAGAATLISAANPSFHKAAVDAISLIAIEAPPLFAALVGVAQMAIADGLRRRVDGSMWAATSLSVLAAAYFIFHHERYLDAGFQLAFATFLLWNRRAFYRRARAFTIKLPPVWFAGAAAVVAVAMIAAVLWAGMRPGFRAAPWWSLLVDPVIGRAGRPVAIAGLALSGLAVWRYLATARPARRGPPAAEDYARAEAALDAAVDPRPESQLCFTGDVAFLFSPTDKSFLGYAVAGASLVALAAPVGQPEERRALLSAFCDLAARENLKPVIYAAPASLLPDLLDLGFKVEKIGENAVIDLENFSLAGKARESVRYANRRLTQRLGAHFQVHEPPHPPALYDRLRPVSDAWLAFHKSGEKRFSLGRYDPAILDRCRIGEVDWHG
ncbi:MAG: phosphatidylglycerol lysyltransferase domain-containing protein, partial [Amphiplicatus sp.]